MSSITKLKIENVEYDLKDSIAREEINVLNKNIKNELSNISTGTPLVANSIEEMYDTTRIYVNTSDGNWYYFNGSEWVSGGLYQATSESESVELLKSFYDKIIGKNKFNGKKRTGAYSIEDGLFTPDNLNAQANVDPIPVDPLKTYYFSDNGVAKNVINFQYDSDGNLLVWSNDNKVTTYENCSYINFYGGSLSDTIMVSESSDLTYEPYIEYYLSNKEPNNNVINYIKNDLKPKKDLKICNMGDSLWGSYEGETSLSGIIQRITGATTYNCGFGGCRMTHRNGEPEWNAFSMCTLADSIATGDFSTQENVVQNRPSGMPTYFIDHLNLLKSIDFSEIDILTIGYGVNDYMGGKYVENPNNLMDTNYINGALRYSIEKISTAYPNVCIVVVSPNFAVWFENGVVKYTSDESYYNNGTDVTLPEVVKGLEDVSKEYHIHFINVYDNIGNNKFTALSNFNTNDGVHPNEQGREKMGRYIAYELLGQ